jgi:hypothetical protein
LRKIKEKTEKPGNRVQIHRKLQKNGMGERTDFLLNHGEILLKTGEVCPGLREKIGLRNALAERAIQQVIHIVHIVVHNCESPPFRHSSGNKGENRGKIGARMKFCEICSFT